MPYKLQPEVAPAPGSYRSMSEEDYHRKCAWNSSSIKALLTQSPACLKAAMDSDPELPDGNQIFGTLFHQRVLQPDQYPTEDAFHVTDQVMNPSSRRYNKLSFDAKPEIWKIAQESEPGKTVVAPGWREAADLMAKSVRDNPMAARLLKLASDAKTDGGRPENIERSLFFEHEATALLCKARIDAFVPDDDLGPVIVDLKTTRDVRPSLFRKDILSAGLAYYIQGAFYQMAARAVGLCGEKEWPRVVIVAVQKLYPGDSPTLADTVCYTLSEELLAIGRARCEEMLATIAKCEADDRWPGYETEYPVEPPQWMINAFTDGED